VNLDVLRMDGLHDLVTALTTERILSAGPARAHYTAEIEAWLAG
jgi:hypothetical protein